MSLNDSGGLILVAGNLINVNPKLLLIGYISNDVFVNIKYNNLKESEHLLD
jgi:hypothetical protein